MRYSKDDGAVKYLTCSVITFVSIMLCKAILPL